MNDKSATAMSDFAIVIAWARLAYPADSARGRLANKAADLLEMLQAENERLTTRRVPDDEQFFCELSQLLEGWKQGCKPGEWSDWDEQMLLKWRQFRLLPAQLLDVHAICDERDRLRAENERLTCELCEARELIAHAIGDSNETLLRQAPAPLEPE